MCTGASGGQIERPPPRTPQHLVAGQADLPSPKDDQPMHKVLRRYPRYRLMEPIPVMWRQGRRTAIDRARIVSLRGLLLDTLHSLTPGENIEIVLMPRKMKLRATATVRSVPHKAVAG